MYYQYYLFLTFAIILYIIAVDENFSRFLIIQLNFLKLEIYKYYLLINVHPKSPIANWIWERKMSKVTKILKEEEKDA